MEANARRLLALAVAVCAGGSFSWAATDRPEAVRDRARMAQAVDCRHDALGRVVGIRVSVSKYPHNWRHMVDARAGRNTGPDGKTVTSDGRRWPTVLVKNDNGESERRTAGEKKSGLPAKAGMARDEYPPAEGRSTNAADFRYVPRRENSAQGASMGNQLRPYCNKQRYKLVAAP